jgi:hypothetical protein
MRDLLAVQIDGIVMASLLIDLIPWLSILLK